MISWPIVVEVFLFSFRELPAWLSLLINPIFHHCREIYDYANSNSPSQKQRGLQVRTPSWFLVKSFFFLLISLVRVFVLASRTFYLNCRSRLTTLPKYSVFIIFSIFCLEKMIDRLAELITGSGTRRRGSRIDWRSKWRLGTSSRQIS